jgi:hypothetical protein
MGIYNHFKGYPGERVVRVKIENQQVAILALLEMGFSAEAHKPVMSETAYYESLDYPFDSQSIRDADVRGMAAIKTSLLLQLSKFPSTLKAEGVAK